MTEIGLNRIELQDIGLHNNMLQSGFWGQLKSEFGWKALAFSRGCKTGNPAGSDYLLVLVRELGAGQSLAYIPHGPMSGMHSGGTENIAEQWDYAAELASALHPFLPSGCMFVRFDPPWGICLDLSEKKPAGYPAEDLSPRKSSASAAKLFRKAAMDIQPPSTVILDLNRTEEELLSGMKSKTRYNIRLAAKKGVEVITAGAEDLPEWYELYRTTSERDKIALHSYDYYERIFKLAFEGSDPDSGEGKKKPELRLLKAVIEGKAEAGIVTAWQGKPGADRRATYLYGASSNNKRNYMPSYALQWEAVKQAAAAGCASYDFFGIPPVDNPEHPMYGLYRFKTGFGGLILHRPGCWDFPYKKAAYKAYSAAEKLRNYYYKKFRKK